MNNNPSTEGTPEVVKKRRIRFKSPHDAARYIAKLIRDTERGKSNLGDAYKLASMAMMFVKSFEIGQLYHQKKKQGSPTIKPKVIEFDLTEEEKLLAGIAKGEANAREND